MNSIKCRTSPTIQPMAKSKDVSDLSLAAVLALITKRKTRKRVLINLTQNGWKSSVRVWKIWTDARTTIYWHVEEERLIIFGPYRRIYRIVMLDDFERFPGLAKDPKQTLYDLRWNVDGRDPDELTEFYKRLHWFQNGRPVVEITEQDPEGVSQR